MIKAKPGIEEIVHDVSSKATSLKGAAELLLKASPADRDELIGLMAQHVEGLAQYLGEIRKDGAKP